MNINQIKLHVHDTYKNDSKTTTNFEPVRNDDVINKAYLDTKLEIIEGQIFYIGKDYNDFIILSNKQSIEEILIQRAVKTTSQILYDEGLFDIYTNADKVLKNFLFVIRHRPNLDETNDVIQ